MRNLIVETLVIKHSRADRGYVIAHKDGGRVGSLICNPTPGGMDIYVTNAQHEVWVVLEMSQDGAGTVAFLVPAGPIIGRVGKFRMLGRLARSSGRMDNKFVFQPAAEQDVVIAIGSPLSRSFVVRRGGREIASIVKGTRSLEIVMNTSLTCSEKGIVVGIAIANCLLPELRNHLKDDMKLPKVLTV
jgi:hypothetical protein